MGDKGKIASCFPPSTILLREIGSRLLKNEHEHPDGNRLRIDINSISIHVIVSDRCLTYVDPRVIAIWTCFANDRAVCCITWKSDAREIGINDNRCQYGLVLNPAWISNYIHYKMWYEITYPFPNFNVVKLEMDK